MRTLSFDNYGDSPILHTLDKVEKFFKSGDGWWYEFDIYVCDFTIVKFYGNIKTINYSCKSDDVEMYYKINIELLNYNLEQYIKFEYTEDEMYMWWINEVNRREHIDKIKRVNLRRRERFELIDLYAFLTL